MAHERDVSVYLLPDLVPAGRLQGGLCVAIDVLRATTTIIYALAAGCEAVRPCAEVDEAKELAGGMRAGKVLLGGERQTKLFLKGEVLANCLQEPGTQQGVCTDCGCTHAPPTHLSGTQHRPTLCGAWAASFG